MFGLALSLDLGVCKDKDGNFYSFHYPFAEFDIQNFTGNYGTIEPKFGKTPNELIESGEWEVVSIQKAIKKKYPDWEFKYALKFSFDPNAVYEELPLAKDCDCQGFFYPEEE